MIEEIRAAVSIPVMAKCRIGHFVEARVLEALGVDFIDESEVLTPADDEHHVDKHAFRVPFVCGARDLGEALRRIGEGAAMIRTKGEAGSGNIVEAVRHLRRDRPARSARSRALRGRGADGAGEGARARRYELVCRVAETGRAAGAELRRRRHRDAGRRRALHVARRRGGVRRLGHLQVRRTRRRARGDRARDHALGRRRARCWTPRAASASAMPGIAIGTIPETERLAAARGW